MRPTYEVADVINAFYNEAFRMRIPLALTKVERKASAAQRLFGNNLNLCPACKKGQMVIVHILAPNKDPPK